MLCCTISGYTELGEGQFQKLSLIHPERYWGGRPPVMLYNITSGCDVMLHNIWELL